MVSHRIDLRSDTVTKPTPEMRRAMSLAEVGDDVFGEDPTVRKLEERAAELLGKEAALFLPSGTMANQVAIHVWTSPGQQVLLDARSHILIYELAAMSVLSGVMPMPISTESGFFSAQELAPRIPPDIYYLTPVGLVTVENTHNMHGGVIYPIDLLKDVYSFCKERGIPVHMDGARIFNAAVASEVPAHKIAQYADSVMFSLSKGLACPVGSLLCGPENFIKEARRVRKRFGGGMRQVGILAAAGLIALDTMIDRLHEDHERAQKIAQAIAEIDGMEIQLDKIQTNIVIFSIERKFTSSSFCDALKNEGILAIPISSKEIRMVTHYHITDEDVQRVIDAIRRLMA